MMKGKTVFLQNKIHFYLSNTIIAQQQQDNSMQLLQSLKETCRTEQVVEQQHYSLSAMEATELNSFQLKLSNDCLRTTKSLKYSNSKTTSHSTSKEQKQFTQTMQQKLPTKSVAEYTENSSNHKPQADMMLMGRLQLSTETDSCCSANRQQLRAYQTKHFQEAALEKHDTSGLVACNVQIKQQHQKLLPDTHFQNNELLVQIHSTTECQQIKSRSFFCKSFDNATALQMLQTTTTKQISTAQNVNTKTLNKKDAAIKPEILDDLASRFIINRPNLSSDLVRLLFEIELAHWFYMDFYCSRQNNTEIETNKNQPQPCGIKYFAMRLFEHVPELRQHLQNFDQIFDEWILYKRRVPTFGAILISPDLKYCLLVQSFLSSGSWGFPKGKVNEGESPIHCAAREVYEETGFDIADKLVPNEYADAVINGQYVRLYVVWNVPLDTEFSPRTRQEIKKVFWFPIDALPMTKQDLHTKESIGMKANSFFMVLPFMKVIRNYVNKKRATATYYSSCSSDESNNKGRPKNIIKMRKKAKQNESSKSSAAACVKYNKNACKIRSFRINGTKTHETGNNSIPTTLPVTKSKSCHESSDEPLTEFSMKPVSKMENIPEYCPVECSFDKGSLADAAESKLSVTCLSPKSTKSKDMSDIKEDPVTSTPLNSKQSTIVEEAEMANQSDAEESKLSLSYLSQKSTQDNNLSDINLMASTPLKSKQFTIVEAIDVVSQSETGESELSLPYLSPKSTQGMSDINLVTSTPLNSKQSTIVEEFDVANQSDAGESKLSLPYPSPKSTQSNDMSDINLMTSTPLKSRQSTFVEETDMANQSDPGESKLSLPYPSLKSTQSNDMSAINLMTSTPLKSRQSTFVEEIDMANQSDPGESKLSLPNLSPKSIKIKDISEKSDLLTSTTSYLKQSTIVENIKSILPLYAEKDLETTVKVPATPAEDVTICTSPHLWQTFSFDMVQLLLGVFE